MKKIKKCLGCGRKYDNNYCPDGGKRSNVRVEATKLDKMTRGINGN